MDVNLKERFGNRYRVTYEEAYRAEHGKHGRAEDPWLMVLPCQHGEIFPFGPDRLAAFTTKPGIGRKLEALACCEVHQRSDHFPGYGRELIVTFDVNDFKTVATLLKPKRRRRLSPEQRAKLAECARPFRFKPQGAVSHGAQSQKTARD